jgi:tripartite-type tricarboxylate transporter receptor subunit TctC
MTKAIRALLAALVIAIVAPGLAAAADFYQGKTVRILVPTPPGGAYDTHARLVSTHLGKYIPGNPNVILQYMPGAGGLTETNYLYNVAEKDGLTIGVFNRYTVPAPIVGSPQAQFKPENFTWLGTTASFSDDAYILVIRTNAKAKNVDELRAANPQIIIGNAGTSLTPIVNSALNLNLKIVEGYEKDALDLAVERGEVEGESLGYLAMLQRKKDWVEKKLVRPVLQFGRNSRLPALSDVPTARELVKTPDAKALLLLAETPLTIAYPFALPPGVPADRVAVMRKAFTDMFAAPEVKEDFDKRKVEFSPKNGDELAAIIAEIAKTPKPVIEEYNRLVGDGAGG